MNAEALGRALGHLFFALFVIVVIVMGVVAIVRSSRKSPPSAEPVAYWAATFGLLPGEGFTYVWQAAHALGHPMIATITASGVFALNHQRPQSPPMRLRPEGVLPSRSVVPLRSPLGPRSRWSR